MGVGGKSPSARIKNKMFGDREEDKQKKKKFLLISERHGSDMLCRKSVS